MFNIGFELHDVFWAYNICEDSQQWHHCQMGITCLGWFRSWEILWINDLLPAAELQCWLMSIFHYFRSWTEQDSVLTMACTESLSAHCVKNASDCARSALSDMNSVSMSPVGFGVLYLYGMVRAITSKNATPNPWRMRLVFWYMGSTLPC